MQYNRQMFYHAIKTQLEKNIFYHSLALEACMGAIYDYLKENSQLGVNEPPKEDWLFAGLVHDIDYSGDTKDLHPTKTTEVLAKYNLEITPIVDRIVKDHDASIGLPANKAGWAIRCADSLTGLIVATALVYPSKKLSDVKLSSVIKRFLKEPRFAAGTRRDEVRQCELSEELNIPLEKFIEICFESMKKIANEIEL